MRNCIEIVVGNTLLLFALYHIDAFPITYTQHNPSQEIWNGIGGKQKWESTNYILFSVTGGEKNNSSVSNGRRYLIEKSNGKARFEGVINGSRRIILFNFKQKRLHKIYDGDGISQDVSSYEKEFNDLLKQFDHDFATLCIPANIAQSVGEKATTKIVNAERFLQVPFQVNGQKGKALIATESGLLKQLEYDQYTISIDGYKDTGNGLILPTRFKNQTDDRQSISFQTIASFTSMESAKFEEY